MKALWIAAGIALVGVAAVGAMLPGLPSTIFALGAAACFARSSPRLEAWLLAHRRLGPPIVAWRAERAIPTSAKILAVVSMTVSGVSVTLTAPRAAAVAMWILMAGSAAYVLTRPKPSRERRKEAPAPPEGRP